MAKQSNQQKNNFLRSSETNNSRQEVGQEMSKKRRRKATTVQPETSSHVKNKKTLIWILICVLGMLYQSFETTIQYFRYEVISTTVIEFETRFMMPSGSICYDVSHVRIPTMFPVGHPCRGPMNKDNVSTISFHDPLRKVCQKILLYEHPYTEVHNNLTWDFLKTFKAMSKYMTKFWWFNETSASASPERFKSYYKPPRKCIKFSWDEKVPFEMLNHTGTYQIVHIDTHGAAFKDQSHKAGPSDYYLHDAKSFPKGRDQPAFMFGMPGVLKTTYKPFRIQYLPAPYVFACVNYDQKKGIRSKEDCIENCIRKKNPDIILTQYTD